MRILIPTAGNRSVLINAFRCQPEIEAVVTTEIDDLAPGIFAADRAYRVPRSDTPEFLGVLQAICRAERITHLFPLADLDLVRFASERARFATVGTEIWAADESTVALAGDKWRTWELFHRLEIPTPATATLGERLSGRPADLRFPLYLKPRFMAMKNSPAYFFRVIRDEAELHYWADSLAGRHQDYLVQEDLSSGREINIDFFVQEHELKRLVTLYRLKAGDGGGIIRGRTISADPRLRLMAERLAGALDFRGAANFQAYAMPDGRMLATEINPRFSNSSALVTRPAGVDFFALTVGMIRGERLNPEFDNYRLLAVTSRYEPVVVEGPTVIELRTDRPRRAVA
jgi:carbamoyl-phosphate synthase large subunit